MKFITLFILCAFACTSAHCKKKKCGSDPYPACYEGVAEFKEWGRELEAIARFIPENPIIFEAGGHYGTDTVRFAARWPKAQIISFEPNPHAFAIYQETTRDYPNIMGYNIAVSDRNGEATLNVCHGVQGDPVFEGASSLLPATSKTERNYRGPKVTVPCVTLDDWSDENQVEHFDFMWLDLEGLELQVLKGGPRTLSKVKVIYAETNFQKFRHGMTQYKDLRNFLEAHGFVLAAHWYHQGLQGNALFVRKDLM